MSAAENSDHWQSLAEQLGAEPAQPSSPLEPPPLPPRPQRPRERAERRAPPSQAEKPASGDWSRLASELGVSPIKPEPTAPAAFLNEAPVDAEEDDDRVVPMGETMGQLGERGGQEATEPVQGEAAGGDVRRRDEERGGRGRRRRRGGRGRSRRPEQQPSHGEARPAASADAAKQRSFGAPGRSDVDRGPRATDREEGRPRRRRRRRRGRLSEERREPAASAEQPLDDELSDFDDLGVDAFEDDDDSATDTGGRAAVADTERRGQQGEGETPGGDAGRGNGEERERRRRRRRGRRGEARGEHAPIRSDAAANAPARRNDAAPTAAGHLPAAPDEDADLDDGEADEDREGAARINHRNIPSWEEAIGVLIAGNMEARAKSPHSGGGHRGRGRGRDRSGDGG